MMDVEWDMYVGDIPINQAFKNMPRSRVIRSLIRIKDATLCKDFNVPAFNALNFEREILPTIIKEQLTDLIGILSKARIPLLECGHALVSTPNQHIYQKTLEMQVEQLKKYVKELEDQISQEVVEDDDFDY